MDCRLESHRNVHLESANFSIKMYHCDHDLPMAAVKCNAQTNANIKFKNIPAGSLFHIRSVARQLEN